MWFKLYKEKLSINLDSITNVDVRYLWDLDDSKDKDTALKAILYVFFTENLSDENPLSQIPYYEKRQECLLRAFGDTRYDIEHELGTEWLEAITTARESYRKDIPDTLKDISTFDRKMDELGVMLNKTKPVIKRNVNENDDKVSFATNIEIINKALISVVNIIQSKASLVALHVQGTVPKELRGGLSPMSKGKIKTKL
jgi:hypothetical protein